MKMLFRLTRTIVIVLSYFTASVLCRAGDRPLSNSETPDEALPLVETVVVTAQKREENVQEIAASISVISAANLSADHLTQLTDLSASVPGLSIDTGGTPGQATITLRGVTPVGNGATVGTYIDDAPVGSSNIFNRASGLAVELLPYDIERIEVLRGPQGTLYGASATGGLLKYVTRAPDLEHFALLAGGDFLGMDASSQLGGGGRLTVNVPLVNDVLAVRAGYAYEWTPGWIDNSLNGRKDQNGVAQQSGRVAMLWRASDSFSFQLAGLWQRTGADNNSRIDLAYPSLTPSAGDASAANQLAEPFHSLLEYYTATIKWRVAGIDVTSATSYSNSSSDQIQDGTRVFGVIFPLFGLPVGLTPFSLNLGLHKWTEELRLASPGGRQFEWLIGGFYTSESGTNDQMLSALDAAGVPIAGINPLFSFDNPTSFKEFAGFGQGTFHFTEQMELSAGLRWAKNHQSFTEATSGPLSGSPTTGSSEDSVWSYMVSPAYHFTPNTMLYGRFATGYTPGGPNAAVVGIPPQVGADRAINSEVGVKSTLLDGRAVLDLAAYRVTRSDIQIDVVKDGVGYLANGGRAVSKGLELTASYLPIPQLRLGLNGAYTNARLTNDVPSLGGKDGDRLPRVPEYSGAFTVDIDVPLYSQWQGTAGLSYRYVGGRLSDVQSASDAIPIASYNLLDGYLQATHSRWTTRLFIKNLGNSHGDLTRTLVPNALGQFAYAQAAPLQPRTIGLSVDLRL